MDCISCIAIEHCSKSPGSIYPYTKVMCYWSMGLMCQGKLKLRVQKQNPYDSQVALFKVTLMKTNKLLSICISNLSLRFGFDIQSQIIVKSHETEKSNMTARWPLLKINRLLSIYTSNVLLKFGLDIQSQTEVRAHKLKNPIWPPGSHCESNIAEASFHTHK